MHFEQESGKVCFKRTPSACSAPCGGEAEKCQQAGEEWRATTERNGGSCDQGGVKAKSAQRPGRCQGLLMETGTGEKVSFLKVSSQFSEKQYAAPLPSGFTSPYLSSPRA